MRDVAQLMKATGTDHCRDNARNRHYFVASILLAAFLAITFCRTDDRVRAQETGPSMVHPNLAVRPIVSDLVTPITMAFLGTNDILVLEKNTGKVKRVVNGAVQSTVLDLAVNFASERGLLGIALHPDFPTNPGVYLFWTCHGTPPPAGNPFFPVETECPDMPVFGADTDEMLAVPKLANRVDRFIWNGATLAFDRNLIKLLAFQNDGAPTPPGQMDETQPARGNHDGGVIAFGPDRKLYIMFGDSGRRGQLQNLPSGPTLTGLGPPVPDDQLGGPQPDDAHFSGVILRLNDDGSTPTDNPLFNAGTAIGGEVGENIRKVFAYGVRNSFGMAFDPVSGNLWDQENGEDAFDELNLIEPGMNSGWIQIIGPAARVPEYKLIETTALHHEDFPNLQQFRWGPERIADTPQEALSRLFVLPGSRYSDPEFSWKHVLAPAAIGFLNSGALGPQFFGDLFVGFSVPEPLGGPLFHFNLTGNRRKIGVDDPRLEDRVADNLTFHDMTESETLLIGRDFGILTDIKTGPNGNLFVISLDQGTIYEIFRER
jgi:glucose/arabinose dehydrogenase